jgi:hypothetical protein
LRTPGRVVATDIEFGTGRHDLEFLRHVHLQYAS